MQSLENRVKSYTPTLEEFGLEASIYEDFRIQQEELNHNLSEYKKIITSTENNRVIISILTILFLTVVVGGYLLTVKFFPFIKKILLMLWFPPLLILLVLIVGVWPFFLSTWIVENSKKYIYNFITYGKYEKALEAKQKIEQQLVLLHGSIKNRVLPFEQAFHDYYQKKLENFYSTRLYRKRSDSLNFKDSLSEFDSMVDSVSKANNILLTKKIYLDEHRNYLEKRRSDYSFQQEKMPNKESVAVIDFVRKISQSQVKQKAEPPEKNYRIPKKIDWEKVFKDRKIIGTRGEEIVVALEQDYLRSIQRNDLADKVRHVSREDGDGSGYDILSFFSDGREKYIEIKSTTQSFETPFYLSRNELGFLREHLENSFIYRILLIENNDVSLEVYPSIDFVHTFEIIPIQYLVKTKVS